MHHTDGNEKNYDDLINHLERQFQAFQKMKIQFLEMIAEDNKVFTLHALDVVLKNGERNLWQGHALFYIENNKIVRSFELTHLDVHATQINQ